MDQVYQRMLKLLSVKSIVTLVLTLLFAYLAVVGTISGQEVMTIFVTVISFYFGTQSQRGGKEAAAGGE